MKKILLWLTYSILTISVLSPFCFAADRFSDELNQSVDEVKEHLEMEPVSWRWYWEWVKEFMIFIAQKIMIPASIIIWVLVAIFGFYQMMFSDKEDEQKKWRNFIMWWVIWILIMMSWYYIAMKLVWTSGTSWEVLQFNSLSWIQAAKVIYATVMYPLLKIVIYLVVWLLFIMLMIHAYKMMMAPWDDTSKKSTTIVIWNIIWIIIILFSKNLVELVYWTSWEFQWWDSLAMSEAILDNSAGKIWFIHTIINWVMWFAAFIVLIIILYQSFMLLTKPDDADTLKKMWKNLIFVFVWILIIGAWYLITNFFIIK